MADERVIGVDDIALLRPYWALAAPVIAAAAYFTLRRASRLGDWRKSIDPDLMRAMAALGRVEGGGGGGGGRAFRRLAGAAPFVAALAIAAALLGPAVERADGQSYRNLDGAIFVIDVSPSMTTDAAWPAALTMAQAGLSALGSKPAALIVYAGDSYVASPLTLDRRELGQTMTLLDEKTVPDPGSRPALALRRAADMLREAAVLAGDVVLVTDGAGFGAETLTAAQDLAALGARLMIVRAETSVAEEPPPDPTRVEATARAGAGAVFAVTETDALMRAVAASAETRLAAEDIRLLFWSDYGRYLLALALIPVIVLFRREAQ